MKDNFPKALAIELKFEGGYSNRKTDNGGETNFGVTWKTYNAYRRRMGKPIQSVKWITPAEVAEIYHLQYWDAIKADLLPSGIDIFVLDGAINSGPGQSIKWLQRGLGTYYTGKIDGVMGQKTLDAVNNHPDPVALINAMKARRLAFLHALEDWKSFGGGWESRIDNLTTLSISWLTAEPDDQSAIFHNYGNEPADISQAKKAPAATLSDAATGAGISATGVGAYVDTVKDTLTQFTSAAEWIGHIVMAITIAGVAVTGAGVAYSWYARRQRSKLADALDSDAAPAPNAAGEGTPDTAPPVAVQAASPAIATPSPVVVVTMPATTVIAP